MNPKLLHTLLEIVLSDFCLALLAGCALVALVALLRYACKAPVPLRRTRPWVRGGRHRKPPDPLLTPGADTQSLRCQLVEPAPGTVGLAEQDRTTLHFTLEVVSDAASYLVMFAFQKEPTYDRALQRDAGRFRAISVPYQIAVRRNRGPAVLAGAVRLTFDGHCRLARVIVQRMKPPFPFLAAPIGAWFSEFMNQKFTYDALVTRALGRGRHVV